MERQPKRRRLQYENPDRELYEKRALNDLHLKSRFEAIFEKYGKDFSATGDEIDFETGEIVVNKGHIQGMAHEHDIGLDIVTTVDDLDEEDILSSSILKAAVLVTSSDVEVENSSPRSMLTPLNYNSSRNTASSLRSSIDERFSDSTHGHIHSSVSTATPLRRLETDPMLEGLISQPMNIYDSPIEPAWQAPPLPKDKMANVQQTLSHSDLHKRERFRSLSPPSGSLWATPSGPGCGRTKRLSDKRNSNKSAGHKPWAREEEKLLRHLRTNTNLSYAQIAPQFPGRSCHSISKRWPQIAGARNTLTHVSNEKGITLGLDNQLETGKDGCGASSEHRVHEDSDVDELHSYDCVTQGSKPLACRERSQEQSPEESLPQSDSATIPPSITELIAADAQDRSEEGLASVELDAPNPLSPIAVSNTSPRTQSPTPCEISTSPSISSPLSRLAAANPVVTPITSRISKEPDLIHQATVSSKIPIRPLDDSSEDELATPIPFAKRPGILNARKVLPKPKASYQPSPTCFMSASPRLQGPMVLITAKSTAKSMKPKAALIDDGSEDELSTPLRTAMMKHPTEPLGSKRRKSSRW